jgi:hypothetical protein
MTHSSDMASAQPLHSRPRYGAVTSIPLSNLQRIPHVPAPMPRRRPHSPSHSSSPNRGRSKECHQAAYSPHTLPSQFNSSRRSRSGSAGPP